MQVINPVSLAATGTPSSSTRDKTTLDQQDFFKIMIAELTHQDPLEPMQNNEFLQQVAQMQTLETMTRLSEGIEALLLGQQVSAAGALIGKVATGVDAVHGPIEGVVDRVLVNGDEVVLGIGDKTLTLSGVSEIQAGE